jgi:D-alanine-D-alanine ligase-like ATP-grasp enzyme
MNKEQEYESIKAVSSRIMAMELSKRNIKIEHLNPFNRGDAFLRLTFRKHTEFIFGTKSSLATSSASVACSNKALTKCLLAEQKLSVTEGQLLLCADRAEIKSFARKLGFPCVLKKYNGSLGSKVFIGVSSVAECEQLLEQQFCTEKYVLVEKQFFGPEYRFLSTRRKVLGVVLRDPANVIGDGQSTVRELIERKNETKLKKYNIKLDAITLGCLKSQGIGLETVAAAGVKVRLRNNSNASTGGDTVDFTAAVHPEFKKLAMRAVQAIPGLPYAGIDIMVAQDITAKPKRDGYAIIELNSNPDIFIHHNPDRGKSRDVAAGIVDLLFPETKKVMRK